MSDKARDPIDEFLDRVVRGEALSLEEYVALHPELDDESLARLRKIVRALGVGHVAPKSHASFAAPVQPGAPLDVTAGDPSGAATASLFQRLARHTPPGSRYKLEGEVARGGMGVILKVWDEDLRRHLAMKVVLGAGGSPSTGSTPPVDSKQLARFLEEAQITGQLDHPGIVPVHELGLDSDGRVYFTMKLVKGRDLKQIFDLVSEEKEGWNETRALWIFLKVCEALAYAHTKGVIHRDLKPANVMVGNFGEVYVMDWGLARVIGRKDSHDIRIQPEFSTSLQSVKTERREQREEDADSPIVTMDGDVVGTPAYMAPEQARGEVEMLTARSDVYAVGAMLYQLLARQRPYVGTGARVSNRTVLAMVIQGPPQPLSTLRRNLPAELVAICEKAMARDPGDRYADTLAFAEDLKAFLEGRVVRAHRTGALVELSKWIARNKGTAAAIAAGLILAIGGLATISFLQSRANTRIIEAKDQARWQAYLANLRAAALNLDENMMSAFRRNIDACPEEYRGVEWVMLSLHGCCALLTVRFQESNPGLGCWATFASNSEQILCFGTDGSGGVYDAETGTAIGSAGTSRSGWRFLGSSRDGHRVAWRDADGLVRVLEGDRELSNLESLAGTNLLVWSPDGRRIAGRSWGRGSSRPWEILLVEPETGRTLGSFPVEPTTHVVINWSTDGSRLAFTESNNTVVVLDPETRQPLFRVRIGKGMVTAIGLSPDGRMLGAATREEIGVWNIETSERIASLGDSGRTEVERLAWSPDGSYIATGSHEQTVRVWDVSNPGLFNVLRGHELAITSLEWRPDGRRILTGSMDGTFRIWDPETRGAVTTCPGPQANGIIWESNGTRILTNGGRGVTAWDPNTGEPMALLCKPNIGAICFDLSPDGASIVTGCFNGTVCISDTATGERLAIRHGHQRLVQDVEWSPDGRRIASCSEDGTIRLWEVGSEAEPQVLDGHSKSVRALAFDPRGTQLHAGAIDGTVRTWDVETKTQIAIYEHPNDGVLKIELSPDGRRLVCATNTGSIHLWDLPSRRRIASSAGYEDAATAIAWSPDGRRFASCSRDNTVRIWDGASGEDLLVLPGEKDASLGAIAWSPDGKRLAATTLFGGRRPLRIWESELSAAGRMWEAAAQRRSVQARVEALFLTLLREDDVVAQLNSDPDLDEGQRRAAVRMAGTRGDLSSSELNDHAWKIAADPNETVERYATALHYAEAAVQLATDDKNVLNTLGVAQFRTGQYERALATLSRSSELKPDQPADLAFLAMAHARLGHDQEARASLESLRALVLDPRWSNDTDSQAFLKEAEASILGAVPDAPRK